MAWIADHARFVLSFVRHPLAVGSVIPSSRWLARRMVADMDLARARTIVEVGPGTGPFTALISREISPDAMLLAIELDRSLADGLQARFPKVKVVHDSAEHLPRHLAAAGRSSADAILSSLPWAAFPPDVQRTLMSSIAGSLRPGGKFATFTYLHATWLRAAQRFRDLLGTTFTTVETTRVVWLNFPPAYVYRCSK